MNKTNLKENSPISYLSKSEYFLDNPLPFVCNDSEESLNIFKKMQNLPSIKAKAFIPSTRFTPLEPVHKNSSLFIQIPINNTRKNKRTDVPSNNTSRNMAFSDDSKSVDNKIVKKNEEKLKPGVMKQYFLVTKFIKNLLNHSKYRKMNKLKQFHYDIIKDLSYSANDLDAVEENYCHHVQQKILRFLCNFLKFSDILKNFGNFNIIKPNGIYHVIFDIFMLFNTLCYFVLIPIKLSFSDFSVKLSTGSTMFLIYFSIFLFFIEISLNFNLAYYEKGELIVERRKIIRNYLKNQFFKDFLSIFYILYTFLGNNEKNSLFISFTSLLYLFRYQNLTRMFNRIEEFLFLDDVSSNILSFIKFIFRLLLLSHIFACIWHYIGYMNSSTQLNWLQNRGILSSPWNDRYIESLYFVAVVSNTVGFGDIVPISFEEKVFCIIFIYIVCGLFAYAINSVGLIMHNINRSKTDYKRNISVLNGYMKEKNIGYALRVKLKNYFEYIFFEEKSKTLEESTHVINKLSSSLKEELLLNANGIHLRALPMFNKNFSEISLRKLTYEMKEINMVPGDIIYRQYDTDDSSLYFLKKGEVQLFIENPIEEKTIIKKLHKGDIFGQLSFFGNFAREVTAKCLTFTSMFAIKKEDFIRVIKQNDEDFETFSIIKDNLMLNNDFERISLKCYSCNEYGHITTECPLLRVSIPKTIVIQKSLYTQPQNRKQFYRKIRNPQQKALKNTKKMQSILEIMKISNNNLSQDDEINRENEISEKNQSSNELLTFHTMKSNKINEFDIDEPISASRKNFTTMKSNVFEKNHNFFEKMKNYTFYFPTYNFQEIIEKIKVKSRKSNKIIQINYKLNSETSVLSNISFKKTPRLRDLYKYSKEQIFFKTNNVLELKKHSIFDRNSKKNMSSIQQKKMRKKAKNNRFRGILQFIKILFKPSYKEK